MFGKKNLILVSFAAIVLAGCSSPSAYVDKSFSLGEERAEWVAILPFQMEGEGREDVEVEKILRKRFFETFSYLGYLDRDINKIDESLKKIGLYDPVTRDNHLSSGKLGELFGADYLVVGTVRKVVNFTGLLYSKTLISAELKMIEVKSGREVWRKDHDESVTSSIIIPESVVTVIQNQAENANTEKVFNIVAEKFVKNIMKSIPDPTSNLLKNVRLPKIRNIGVRIEDKDGGENSALKVAMIGDPEMKAAFDIGNWKTNIPMKETQPGRYEGSYRAGMGDWAEDCMVIGKLTNKDGIAGTRVYRKQLVRFGHVPD